MMDEYEKYDSGSLLNDRYLKVADISEGSYGLVSVAKDTLSDNKLVAVKFIYPVDYKKNEAQNPQTTRAKTLDSKRATSSPAKLRSNIISVNDQKEEKKQQIQSKSSILRALYEEASKEIKIHQILGHHPNISSLYDHFDSCLVLEYCARGDLYEAIQNGIGPSLSKDIKEVFFQILNALEYCHSHGVYHRDLKPENILISEDWSIKLCDWGLATTSRTITNKSEFDIGSERYMAPELFDVKSEFYDASKIDLWSVGIILLTLVFHKNPFQVANDSDKRFLQFAANREALFDIFSTMTGEMFSVLRYCLNIDPNNRDLYNLKFELNSLKYFTFDEEDWASDYDYDFDDEAIENDSDELENHYNDYNDHYNENYNDEFDLELNHDDEFHFNTGSDSSINKKDDDSGDRNVSSPSPEVDIPKIENKPLQESIAVTPKYIPPKHHHHHHHQSPEPTPIITTTDTTESEIQDSISDLKEIKAKKPRPKSVSHLTTNPRADLLLDIHDDDISNQRMPHNPRADALLSSNEDLKPIPMNNGGLKFIRNTRKPFNVPSYSHSRKINGSSNHNNRDKFAREDFFTPKSMFSHYMDKYNRSSSYRGNYSSYNNNNNNNNNKSNTRQHRSDWKKNGRKRQSWKYRNNNGHSNNHHNKNHQSNTSRSKSQHNNKSRPKSSGNFRLNNEGISGQKKKQSSSFSSSKSRKHVVQSLNGNATSTNNHNPLLNNFHTLNHPNNTSNHGSPGTSVASANGKYIPPYLRSPNYARSPVIEPVTEEIDNLTLDSGNYKPSTLDGYDVFHLEEDFDLAFNHNNSNETNKSLSSVNTNSTSVNSFPTEKRPPSFKVPTYSLTSLSYDLQKMPGENAIVNGNTHRNANGRRHSINRFSDVHSALSGMGISSSPSGKYIPPFRRGSHSAVTGNSAAAINIKGKPTGEKRRSGYDYDKTHGFTLSGGPDHSDSTLNDYNTADNNDNKHSYKDVYQYNDLDNNDHHEQDHGYQSHFNHRQFLNDLNEGMSSDGITSSSVPSYKTDWFPVKKDWIDYDE